jgi:hypothetical protein
MKTKEPLFPVNSLCFIKQAPFWNGEQSCKIRKSQRYRFGRYQPLLVRAHNQPSIKSEYNLMRIKEILHN